MCASGSAWSGRFLFPVAAAACVLVACPAGRAQDDPKLNAAAVMAAAEQVLSDVIERNERSVVAIARVRPQTDNPGVFSRDDFRTVVEPGDPKFVPNEFATGVVIDASGLVLTNYHVLEKGCDYWVTTSERKTYRAQVKASDHRSDLAVLALDVKDPGTKEFTPIKLGDAAKLKKGHIVVALGNPYSIARDGQPSATWGIVSNLSRRATDLPAPFRARNKEHTRLNQFYGTLIQTDARLPLGTSGGALLNLKGEMIGLTTSIAAAAGYEQEANFAIPVDDFFLRALEALKKGKEVEYGFLGVEPEDRPADESRRGRSGVVVASVRPGSPAHRGGLIERDVITAINGEPVHSADDLVLAVGKLPVEARTRLTIERFGQTEQATVELGKFPDPAAAFNVFTPEPDWRGLRVDYPTVQTGFAGLFMRRHWAMQTLEPCVLVRDVQRSSPAWEGGLRPGMMITHVDGTAVESPREFRAAVEERKGEVSLRIGGLDLGGERVKVIRP
ncbi:MAG: trypsin-like peptidase domain-containing protein [Planctomycetia bacterium]|nr:trypsin-like peptidase domain-containing protein [Planctomycetia bacterium]